MIPEKLCPVLTFSSDILNQVQYSSHQQALLEHIFPRQFGLFNVFTSHDDPSKNTSRIAKTQDKLENGKKFKLPSIPKRLRGSPSALIMHLLKWHRKCSYSCLLEKHCPVSCYRDSRSSYTKFHRNSTSRTTNHQHVMPHLIVTLLHLFELLFAQ